MPEMSTIQRGALVRLPEKPEWGLGRVLDDPVGSLVTIYFDYEGQRRIDFCFEKIELVTVENLSPIELAAVQRFGDGEEEEYLCWVSEHPHGFVVNCRPGRWTIHRAGCPHLQPFRQQGYSLTSIPKACSPGYNELKQWARQLGVAGLRSCSTCSA